MALSSTSRSNLANTLSNTSKDEKNPTTQSALAKTLGLTDKQYVRETYTPPVVSSTARTWAQEGAMGNGSLISNVLSSGPVGGFLNAIQKPLAVISSATKEGIDLFTGQDASWGDFSSQVGTNYGFGRILGDYDLLQGDGWQKWAARGIGFAGDAIFDPLNLLKPVNLAAKLGRQVSGQTTRVLAGELARNAVLQGAFKKGGVEGLQRVAKQFEGVAGKGGLNSQGVQWETIADDIGNLKQGKPTIGKWKKSGDDLGWELKTAPNELGEELVVKISNVEIDEIDEILKIGSTAITKGPTSVSGKSLKTVAQAMAKTQMDVAFRVAPDSFAGALGANARLPAGVSRIAAKVGADGKLVEAAVGEAGQAAFRGANGRIVNSLDELVEEGASSWRGAVVRNADEAEVLKYEFGIAMPFTGAVGRTLGLAKKAEKLSTKFVRSGAQYPVGLRLMTTQTPYLGRTITGIPQGLRTAIRKVGGTRMSTALLKSAGKMGDLKVEIRDSDNVVFRQQGKRVVHAVARGDSASKQVTTRLQQKAAPFLQSVKDLEADVSDVYYALGGDAEAIAKLNVLEEASGQIPGTLVAEGRKTFDEMRLIANRAGMSDFLGDVDSYIPRQMTDELRKALFEDPNLSKHKFSKTVHKKRGKHTPTLDQSRKYVATDSEEWAEAVAERAAKKGISVDAAAKAIRKEGKLTDQFYGETLSGLGVEKQISDILERTGADYSLFVDDIDKSINGWIKQVSSRVGEVYTEQLLKQEGILIDRIAEFNFMPNQTAVALGATFRKAQANVARVTSDLEDAIKNREAEFSEHNIQALDLEIESLQKVESQAIARLKRAQLMQEDVFVQATKAEIKYNKALTDLDKIDNLIAELDGRVTKANDNGLLKEAAALEKRRVAIKNKRLKLLDDFDAPMTETFNTSAAYTAYEIVASSTMQRLHIERALASLFGAKDSFNTFVRQLGDINVSQLDNEIAALVDDGADFVSVGPSGEYLWKGPDGIERNLERLFMNLDGVLGKQDADGIGVWLGVERDLDSNLANLLNVNNPAQKLDWSLKKIDLESSKATNLLESLNEFDEIKNIEIAIPTAEKVAEAKKLILDKLKPSKGNTLSSVIDSEDVRDALSVYFAGNGLPVAASVSDGKTFTNILDQIDQSLITELKDINSQLDELIAISEANDFPIKISYEINGEIQELGIRDYVYLKQIRETMNVASNSSLLPVGRVRTSVDQIVANGELISGTVDNGVYQVNGEKFIVKKQMDGALTSVDKAATEVLSNALYRQLGFGAPDVYPSTASLTNEVYTVSPYLDNVQTLTDQAMTTGRSPFDTYVWNDQYGRTKFTSLEEVPPGVVSGTMGEQLTRGFMADVLLGNQNVFADGTGIGLRTGVPSNEVFTRLNTDQAFFSGADGLPKSVSEPGWLPETVSEFDSLRTSSQYGELFAQGEVGNPNVAGLISDQTNNLLNVRAQFGGFENFVRRSMPGLSSEDVAKYASFLDVRLKGIADSQNVNFFEVGSDDLMRQNLLSRGYSRRVVEAAFADGKDTVMALSHELREGGQHMNLFQKANGYDLSLAYGDTFGGLNANVAGLSFDGGEDAINLLLDLPLGADSIKVYGLVPNASEFEAATLAIKMSSSTDPVELENISRRFYEMGSETGDVVSNHDGIFFEYSGRNRAATEMRVDQWARVAESDPEFFASILNKMERSIKNSATDGMPSTLSNPAAGTRFALEELDVLRWVNDVSSMNFSDSFADKALYENFKTLSFADRLQFAAWHRYRRTLHDFIPGSQPQTARYGPKNYARKNLTGKEWGEGSAAKQKMRNTLNRVPLNSNFAESFKTYQALIDPNLNPDGWIKETIYARISTDELLGRAVGIGKGSRDTGLNLSFNEALTPREGARLGGDLQSKTDLFHNIASRKGSKTYKSTQAEDVAKFYEIYQRSLSADGYSASFWLNNERVNSQGFDPKTGAPVEGTRETMRGDQRWSQEIVNWPNFMLNNPTTVRSADINFTSQSLPKFADDVTTSRKGVDNRFEVAIQQRAEPENVMLKSQSTIQENGGGGGLTEVLEQGGDLSNRLVGGSAAAEVKKFDVNAAVDMSKAKIKKVLDVLGFDSPNTGQSFRKDFEDSIAEAVKKGNPNAQAEIEKALSEFGKAHSKLKPTNRPQRLATDAMVAVGELRFEDAVKILRELQTIVDEGPEALTKAFGDSLPAGNLKGAAVYDTLEEAQKAGFTKSQFNASRGARKSADRNVLVDPVDFMKSMEADTLNKMDFKVNRFLKKVGVDPAESGNPLEALYSARASLVENQAQLKSQFEDTIENLGQIVSNESGFRETNLWREELGFTYENAKGVDKRLTVNVANRKLDLAAKEVTETQRIRNSLVQSEETVKEAYALLDSIKANVGDNPGQIPQETYRNLETVVNILTEAENYKLRISFNDFKNGDPNWKNTLDDIDASNWDVGSIKNMPKFKKDQAIRMLDESFRDSFKPIGNNLQGPNEIVDALTASEKWVARGQFKGFMKVYDNVHNLLRAYMIAKPGFHGRNFFSATFMNHLAGVDAGSYRQFMRGYWKFQEEEAIRMGLPDRAKSIRKSMVKRGIKPENVDPQAVQYIRQLDEAGALGGAGGQVASEFVQSDAIVSGRKISLNKINPFSTSNAALQLSRDVGMATETFVRGSLGFDTLKKGGTSGEAFDQIMKFHFDYSDLSGFEKNVVKKVVPFYTWQRKNLPLMLEQFAKNPQVFNRYNSLKKNMEQDLDKDAIIPEWMQRSGAIQTPFKYKGENMYIAMDMPFSAPMELIDPALRFDKDMSIADRFGAMGGALASNVTPLIKAPFEMGVKRDLWRGRSFDGRYIAVPTVYTMIPGLMPVLQQTGMTGKNNDGDYVMKDWALHGMAQLLPTLMDARRLAPMGETKYEQRLLTNWISFFTGTGLRTNTQWEQQQTINSNSYKMRQKRNEERGLR